MTPAIARLLFARLIVERWLESISPNRGEYPDEYLAFIYNQSDFRHMNCYAIAARMIEGR